LRRRHDDSRRGCALFVGYGLDLLERGHALLDLEESRLPQIAYSRPFLACSAMSSALPFRMMICLIASVIGITS
jgi:hypothetical protein